MLYKLGLQSTSIISGSCHGCDHLVVKYISTYASSAYHHIDLHENPLIMPLF